jgi:hypothetical protein
MPGIRHVHSEAETLEAANRRTRSLAGLAATLAVLVVCVFLVKQLAFAGEVEDCLMANRSNCDRLVARLR